MNTRKLITVLDPESMITSANVIAERRRRFGNRKLHPEDEFNAQYLVNEGYPVSKVASFFNVSLHCIAGLAERKDRAVITQKLFDNL